MVGKETLETKSDKLYGGFATPSRLVQAALAHMPYDEMTDLVERITKSWLRDATPVEHFDDYIQVED